jgi:hypothetical protein
MTSRQKLFLTISVILACVLVIVIGMSYTNTTMDQSFANTQESVNTDCYLGTTGHDVEVAILNTNLTCGAWIQDLAPIGLNWVIISQIQNQYSAGTADGETMSKVCVLSGGSSGNMVVEDAGGMYYGTSICSQEEANGWIPPESSQ